MLEVPFAFVFYQLLSSSLNFSLLFHVQIFLISPHGFHEQMTTAVAVEDVRREVKILRALTGHRNLAQFYDAFEDAENVYIVME